jgi:hypothetical protein
MKSLFSKFALIFAAVLLTTASIYASSSRGDREINRSPRQVAGTNGLERDAPATGSGAEISTEIKRAGIFIDRATKSNQDEYSG